MRIKEAREKKNLKQSELAEQVGTTPSAISNYESGVSFPKEKILYQLLNVLEVEPNYLFQDEMSGMQQKKLEADGNGNEREENLKKIYLSAQILSEKSIQRVSKLFKLVTLSDEQFDRVCRIIEATEPHILD